MTLVFNLNYSPFKKGAFFDIKKDFFEEWLRHAHPGDTHFRKYASLIASDHDLPPPVADHEYEDLFDRVKHMRNVGEKGPLVKMMRWFSWFESWEFYRKDIHSLKMILEAFLEEDKQTNVENLPTNFQSQDAQKELRDLKTMFGGWTTAYMCINTTTVWQSKCLMAAVGPTWTNHSSRIRCVTGPDSALRYEIVMANGGWQIEIQDILTEVMSNAALFQTLGLDSDANEGQMLEFLDLLLCVMQKRAISLAHHEEPPRSFATLLGSQGQESIHTFQSQWQAS